jgi:hypothetical protein
MPTPRHREHASDLWLRPTPSVGRANRVRKSALGGVQSAYRGGIRGRADANRPAASYQSGHNGHGGARGGTRPPLAVPIAERVPARKASRRGCTRAPDHEVVDVAPARCTDGSGFSVTCAPTGNRRTSRTCRRHACKAMNRASSPVPGQTGDDFAARAIPSAQSEQGGSQGRLLNDCDAEDA